MKPYVVGITGASGAIYGIRFVQVLTELGYEIALVISDAAQLVMKEELPVGAIRESPLRIKSKEDLKIFFESHQLERISLYSNKDFTAPIASGSYPTQGMVVIPASTGTLGHIASGAVTHLIHRAAECHLKEGRRLVLVPRETPLSVLQIENQLKLAQAGARILPANPAFYSGAQTIQDLVDFIVGKVLDTLEIPHAVYPRWTGSAAASR